MAKFFIMCLILAGTTHASIAASVWKIEKGEYSLYIGGTLHMLKSSDYPLPHAYNKAFANADKLVFETDIDTLNSPQFQRQSMGMLTYPPGQRLTDNISQETWQLLQQHLNATQQPNELYLGMKPALIGIVLSMSEFERIGLTSMGVDEYYKLEAQKIGKPISWLESPEEQLAFVAAMGQDNPDNYIKYALSDLENIEADVDELRAAWRDGNIERLAEFTLIPFKEGFPAIYQSLIVQRNNNWLPIINSMLVDSSTEFVLVGTMHLIGPDGVLTSLARDGYRISRVR